MPNMNRRAPFSGLLLACAGILASCASRPPAPAGSPAVEYLPEPAVTLRPIEEFARRVKNDDPALPKYFSQGEDSAISVMADWDPFRVTYDLRNARPAPGGRWELDFSIQETGGGRLDDTLLWNISPGDSGVLLSLDDDYQSEWREYFDFFDRYGAKVTFFVTGGYSAFCTEALDRGHDIGCHTVNHLNLPKVSREKFFQETLGAVESFRAAGVPLRAFAYPFGLSEPWMREALAGTFAVQRGFGVRYRLYDRAAVKAGYIVSVSIDNITYKTDEAFEAALTMMLRAAKFIGGDSIVPLTTHTIDEGADWGISPRRLEFLFKTMAELKMRFYRYGDF